MFHPSGLKLTPAHRGPASGGHVLTPAGMPLDGFKGATADQLEFFQGKGGQIFFR